MPHSTLTDVVEVPVHLLDQIHARLSERRIVIEKEVLKYGEAPAGIKEVFELCRGFERAFVEFVNESPVAGKVKEAFLGEKGLAGAVRKAPLEKVFELANVKAVCRYADGYQPHLVSPEAGVSALGMEALDLVAAPVKACVQAVHALLLNAAREASEKAGHYTEAALVGALPMHVPDFKTVVMPAVVAAIDEWSKEAEKMATMLVDMERSYITAGFFRATMYNRYEKLRMQQDMQQQMASQQGDGGQARGMAAKAKSYFPAFGAAKEPEPVQGAGGAMPHHRAATSPTPPPARGGDDSGDEQSGGAAFKMGGDPNDFVAHYFEKCSSNDTALPSSWKWQRRFFIFSDSQRMLYYFKSPEDVPKPNGLRGQVNIAECVIDDLDDRGVPRHPGSPPPSSSDKAHWMIKIRHKDPSRSAVKEHNAIILRAETFASKAEWLGRLRRAIGKPAAETKPTPRRQSGGGGQEGGEHGENGVEQGEGGVPPDGMGRQQSSVNYGEAEPTLDTQLGQGASVFRAEHLRDAAGHLPLAPRVLLNPMRNADKGVVDKVTDTMKAMMTGSFESQYDALLEQFASDMCVYTRMVCDTVVTTVPKAIVHALIKKSQKSLIERLFTVIHKLTPDQMERLLREDDGTVQHRMQARGVFDDVKSAVFAVHQQLERISLGSDRPEKVKLTVNAIAYAGMPALLSTEQKNYYDRLFSHSHAPDCMRFWANPPPMKSVLPGMLPPGVASRRESDSGGADAGRARGPPHGPPGHQPGRGPSAVAPQRPAPGGAPPPVPMRPAPVPGAASVRRAPPPPPPPGGR